MYQDGTTNRCTVVSPTVTYSPSTNSYSVYSCAPNALISLTISQCQSKSTTTTVTVVGKSSLPTWIVFDSTSNTITLRPSLLSQVTDLGTYSVQVQTQTSMYYPAVTTVTIPVTFVKDPLNISGTISDINVSLGHKAYFQVGVTYTDKDVVTMSLTATSGSVPSAISSVFNSTAKTYTFSWSPTIDDVGVYNFVLSLWDSLNIATPRTFPFKVTVNKNSLPYFALTPSTISAKEWTSISYSIPSATDNDGDPITISSTKYVNGTIYPSWVIFDNSSLTFKISPPLGAGGTDTTTYSLDVVLADPYNQTDVSITWKVAMNNLPTVTAISSPINITVPDQKSIQFQILDTDSPASTLSVNFIINFLEFLSKRFRRILS